MEKTVKNTFKKNLILSIIVQVVSLILGAVISLILPKMISEVEYANFQLYALYVGYVGIFHFGIIDGLILRYSQYNYEELDKEKIKSQLFVVLFITFVIAMIVIIISILFMSRDYMYIFILVAIALVIKNVFAYASYVFQMTNLINKYALLIVLEKVFYAFFVIFFLFLKKDNFVYYVLSDLIGCVLAIIICSMSTRRLFYGFGFNIKESIIEAARNAYAGSFLLISNLSSTLLLGIAKQMIEIKFGILTFGKISFSFSLTTLFLTFISAVSIVFFPSLKRMDEKDMPNVYIKTRNMISPFLIFVMILYFPGVFILEKWVPAYSESLKYLGILLPMIIYTSKEALLTNNYYKAYRKEKTMLVINVLSIILGVLLFIVGIVLDDVIIFLYMILISLIARSIISEIYIFKIIKKHVVLDHIYEIISTVIFIICAFYMDLWIGFIFYVIFLIIYLIVNFKKIFKNFIK